VVRTQVGDRYVIERMLATISTSAANNPAT